MVVAYPLPSVRLAPSTECECFDSYLLDTVGIIQGTFGIIQGTFGIIYSVGFFQIRCFLVSSVPATA
jgi:hypothetical protein